MRVIVTGDRAWYDVDLAEAILARLISGYGPALTIVHGAATGIDRSFAEACGEVGLDQESHLARWDDLDAPDAVIRHDKNGRPYNANAGAGQERRDGGPGGRPGRRPASGDRGESRHAGLP